MDGDWFFDEPGDLGFFDQKDEPVKEEDIQERTIFDDELLPGEEYWDN
jgi:hypothetical protein